MAGRGKLRASIKLAIVYTVTSPSRTFARKTGPRTAIPLVPAFVQHSKRDESKRGLNIGLQLKIPQETSNDTLKTIEKELAKIIGNGLAASDAKNDASNPKDKALKDELELKKLLLKPAFECDQWDYRTRTCWLDRNIGDTVTFSLSTGVRSKEGRPDVVWKKEFAQRESKISKDYVINPNRTSRNLVIGRRGYELRVSPITEIDLDDNQFSAAFTSQHAGDGAFAKVNFRIRPMPEDLGFVYIGETLELSIESFVTLPLESMVFHWYTEKEGESASLPSNMRVSETGETLRVSELRQEQEGVVACSVYTDIGVHATKKRFLVKELAKNKDVLKSFSDHNIAYQEVKRQKDRRRTSKYHRPRRIPDSVTTPTEPPDGANTTDKKASPKTGRDANVEGDRYTFVKPFSEDQRPAADDGVYSARQEDANVSIGGSADGAETVLNINSERERNVEEDAVSKLIASCVRDLQCSKHASCVRTSIRERGFCRCLPGFYGPGIFCREEM